MPESDVPRPVLGLDIPQLGRTASDRRWDLTRYVVLVCWIPLLLALPFVGERTARWSDVRDLVASGQVHSVRIDKELPAGDRGSGRVAIHWRHDALRYVTIVRQTGRKIADLDYFRATHDDSNVTAYLDSAPSTRLTRLQPGLEITRGQGSSAYDFQLLGFATGWQYELAALFLWLVGLTVLVSGPQPWRATRWAWFWWITNPIGVAAFLLLAGPLTRVTRPGNVTRRLTGGWAFLLAIAPTLTFTIYGVTLHS